jgi:hypothetical protein
MAFRKRKCSCTDGDATFSKLQNTPVGEVYHKFLHKVSVCVYDLNDELQSLRPLHQNSPGLAVADPNHD